MHRVSLVVVLAAAIASSLVLSGCEDGPKIGRVTGIVTQDDKPLENATVEFQPDYGAPSYAMTKADGSYDLRYRAGRKGALLGHHVVRVTTKAELVDETGTTYRNPETVPIDYNFRTKLEFDVEKGKNVFDIAIEGVHTGPDFGL